ncbi:hypothetical protein PVAND_013534 [Polypedilum vanderplanki]|uniref:Monocarboxylate transporter n=1 Tax=Polypedilum vanderplanki TaxID=319348 RepID=A0A9J6CRW0_POLVA|nr:hypothetical protein PVAND_013534 [Polypedilum vanderplanki]
MDFILNKRVNIGNDVNGRIVSTDSTDTDVRHDFIFGLEDSGIATSNDVHSIEFDDQLPITPPPTVIVHDSGKHATEKIGKVGVFEKNSSKATSSIPSLSINSNATINIHYYPEESIFWSYVIVFISTTVQILIHGLQLSFGIFLIYAKVFFFKNNQFDLITCGWLGALSCGLSLFISPLTIGVCKRKSTRVTAVIGGLVTALGCLFTSFASQFHQMFFSYGTVVGIGVGMCRDCSTLMIAQYFKRKREFVEIFIVSGSGVGIALMSTFIKSAIESIGWRLGLQAVTVCVFCTFILATCYRSASLYHPQRRAILHLKNQKRKIKDKNKQFEGPPFFDFSTLRSKTVRILLLSSSITAFGINTPLFYLAHQITVDGLSDKVLMLQVYLGCSWVLGCVIFGLLVVKNNVECRIARQYLLMTSGFMCGLTMLSLPTINGGNYHAYLLFVWIYGLFLGGYHYSLKMFTFEKVRARNFARAWGFVQFSQSLPIIFGIPIAGYLNVNYAGQIGYYMCAACSIVGSLTLFLVNLHKRNVSRHKEKAGDKKNGGHTCTQTCQKRKLSFDNDQDNEPALQGTTAALILGTDILPHINDVLLNVNGGGEKELTCISEEGIADMDYFPENILDGFDFNNLDDNMDDDVITSCNKVKYSLSEMENNPSISVQNETRKVRRGATLRNNRNLLSLHPVIPEISHESQDEERSILINGHHVECNVNKHLRNNTENLNFSKNFPVTNVNNRVISVIEEAAV